MRLAIVGSTHFATPGIEPWAKQLFAKMLQKHEPDVVISGGAVGVDTWAEQAAAEFGYTRENGLMVVHLPAVRRWHDGFKPRNMLMAQGCTHLFALRCHASKTYGSGWTADYAESIGRVVERRVV